MKNKNNEQMFTKNVYKCSSCDSTHDVYQDERTPESFKYTDHIKCKCGGELKLGYVVKSFARKDVPEDAIIVVDTSDLDLYIACKLQLMNSPVKIPVAEIPQRAANMMKHSRKLSLFIPSIAKNTPWETPSFEEVKEFAQGVFGEDFDKVDVEKLMKKYEEGH